MALDLSKNGVSVVAIFALLGLGVGWAATGTDVGTTINLTLVIAIAGLGGYSIKKGDIPVPADGADQRE